MSEENVDKVRKGSRTSIAETSTALACGRRRDLDRGRDEVLKGWEATWENVELTQKISNHLPIRDGRIVRTQSYLSWQQGLEATGRSDRK